ncbi:hypothetical protein BCV72DRAFT_242161 [Rhizopus microsporus var. microsporus]|uniref:Uncharacterized protein n=2 Tax=Rhizopus microsporus TaxID=58291 RepID=A0A2G4SKJ2_RHIZD|nr:uncharacterized protein RHIMIDRAFT_246260 [Rhizopus microsporus ATCC 52813]ORE06310.1 hypothetical protein BCV72DRAFT_242161 [Rhizopus microsporus var. microsporus]PHZ09298.1 hypothetical protein RHIMIDRAFT_246260 [Rhizopus microsporus ATCC 52813]
MNENVLNNPYLILQVLSFLTDWQDRHTFATVNSTIWDSCSQAVSCIPPLIIDINNEDTLLTKTMIMTARDVTIVDSESNIKINRFKYLVNTFQCLKTLHLDGDYSMRSIKRATKCLVAVNTGLALYVNPRKLEDWKVALYFAPANNILLITGENDESDSEDDDQDNFIVTGERKRARSDFPDIPEIAAQWKMAKTLLKQPYLDLCKFQRTANYSPLPSVFSQSGII